MEIFNRISGAVFADEVARTFFWVIASFLVLAILTRIRILPSRFAVFDRAGPTMMTTLGVLGTFIGIFVGLLDFDVAKIDESVPALLEGLKVAFVTSIVGMSSSFVFRLFQGFVPERDQESTEVTPEVINANLIGIRTGIEKSTQRQEEALSSIRQAISSDGESSLLTQIQKLRTTVTDGQGELITEFREFAKTMAENNSKALIEALQEVIKDFNEKLTEQFGENFKQLNEAVGALLNWQENYKTHVERVEGNIETAVEAISQTEQSLSKIAEHAEAIPKAASELQTLLNGFKASQEELQRHLEAFAGLKESAVNAFPTIEENLKTVTEGVRDAANRFLTETNAVLDKQKETVAELNTSYGEMNGQAAEMRESLKTAVAGIDEAIAKAMDHHGKAIDASASEMQRQIQESWGKTEQAINDRFESFDEQMQQELSRVIESMGRNLASLSEKFVTDYGPITERLREVIRLAEGRP